MSFSFFENIFLFLLSNFHFQVKIKTLERLTPRSKANKAISNLLIFRTLNYFFVKFFRNRVHKATN